MLLALLLIVPMQDDRFTQLLELRRRMSEHRAEAARLSRESHEALDRGDYDAAVGKHKQSRQREAESAELGKKEKPLVEAAAKACVSELDHDDIETRERASARVVAIGPAALPILEKACGAEAAAKRELQHRLTGLIAILRLMEIDAEGRLRQWASEAAASTQYGAADWSAKQATGPPDTMIGGDIRTAWASLTQDGGEEWLELTYREAVFATHVRVRETYNPGAVTRIEAKDGDGKWHVLWEGKDTTKEAPGWLTVASMAPRFLTRTIRVTLDSAGVAGWNEIDAVELIGDPALK